MVHGRALTGSDAGGALPRLHVAIAAVVARGDADLGQITRVGGRGVVGAALLLVAGDFQFIVVLQARGYQLGQRLGAACEAKAEEEQQQEGVSLEFHDGRFG